jgi:UDPglucose 6-dehydrogenase
MQLKIAQIGNGFVGNALRQSFASKGIETSVYDKFQKLGAIDDVLDSNILFLCLPTPHKAGEGYDISAIEENLAILSERNYNGLIAIKSTVLPGTTRSLALKYNLSIMHNPEFLSEKTALQDFNNQEHIVLGVNNVKGLNSIVSFYEASFPYAEISICSSEESESMKIMCNTFYAIKVQMFNEFYLFCQANNIDYNSVKNLMLKNKWINPMHTNVPGPDGKLSYGGSCFPKDTNALNDLMIASNTPNKILEACIKERNLMRDDK